MLKITKRKGWRTLLFTVIALCFASNLAAQVTVEIGTGTTTVGYPYYTLYEDSRTQMIYTASEILAGGGAAGTITSIALNVQTMGSPGMNGFSIDMQNYSGSTLAAFENAGWTNAYSGTYTVAGTGWQSITLTTPFAWDGTSNLLINMCFDNTAWSSNSYVYASTAASDVWHQHTDGAAGCSLAAGAVQTSKPNIQLVINTAPPPPPPTLVTIGTGTTAVSFPYYTLYEDSRTQLIYDASEILAAGGLPGTINSIAFNVAVVGSPGMNGFSIDMQNYSGSTLAGFVNAGWTNTFAGVYTVAASGWQTITLSTPFVWDGTSNLLINVCFDNDAWTSNSTVNGSAIAGKVWHQHTDDAAGCALAAGAAEATRPNIQLDITPSSNLPSGIVQGFVTNGFGVPVPDATVVAQGTSGTYTTTSGPNGAYIIDPINIGTYTMAAVKDGYNMVTIEGVLISEGLTTYQNFELTRPAMAVTPNPYSVTVNPNEMYQGALNINNNGDGILNWTAEVVYPEMAAQSQYPDYLSVRGNYPAVNAPSSAGPAPAPAPYALDYNQGTRDPADMTYCYVAYEGTSPLTVGPASFILNNPANITRFGSAAADFIAAADWANDTWYAVIYGGTFGTIDPTTGAFTNIGSTGDFVGISYNPTNETMYGLTFAGGLQTINLLTGATTTVGSAGTSDFIAFEIDNDGMAYAVNITTDQFGSINLATGAWTSIGPIGFDASYAQDMSCDPSTNELYWAAYDVAVGGKLLIVNKATGTSVLVGSFPGGAEIDGFAIPGSAGVSGGWLTLGQYEGVVDPYTNFDNPAFFNAEGTEAGEVYTANVIFTSDPDVGTVTVPVTMIVAGPALAMPEDLTAVLANAVTGQVNLSWTFVPTDDFIDFVVKRDGVVIGNTTGNTYIDMLPDFGIYSYTVQAVYDEGQSSPAGPVEVEWPNPTIFVDPLYIYDEVWVNNQAVQTITISNTGEGTLAFSFPEWVPDDSPLAPLAYCAASGGCDEYINNVQFGTINNSSGCSNYGDYTGISTEVEPGETYPITITNPTPYTSDIVGIYIDWNQDEDFGGTGEFYTTTQSGGGASFTGSILVPDDAVAGPTRMRVRLQWGGTLAACGTTSYGEVEDYTLEVKAGGFIVSVVPASGTIPTGGSREITVTWDATDFDPGFSYFEDLVVESNDPLNPSVTVENEMYVYVPAQFAGTVTNALNGEPLNGVLVTANPTGTFSTLVYDDGTAESGWGINAGFDAWLGNYFPVAMTGTINSIDVHFIPPYGVDMTTPLTVDFYDNSRNLIGTSGSFLVTAPGWYNVAVPDVAFNGAFYAMVHWNITGGIRYMSWDTNGPNAGAGYGYIMEAGVWSNTDLTPVGLFILRPNVFAGGMLQSIVLDGSKSAPTNERSQLRPSLSLVTGSFDTERTGQMNAGRDMHSFQTMTDIEGEYTLYVDPGVYNVSFEKTGFQTYIEHDTTALAGIVTPLDAQLWEAAYPPSFVYAEVNAEDTECVVTWGDGMGPYEIVYDDGSAENFAAWALPGNMNAVKFTPAEYPATVIGGKIYVGDGSFPNNNTGFLGTTFGAMVKAADGAGGLPGTTLDSISVTVNNYGWVTFTGLDVEITEGDFYLVMVQYTLSPNTAPVGIDENIPTLYRSYSRNISAGGSWGLSPFQDMMMRAILFGSPGATDAIASTGDAHLVLKQRGMISANSPLALGGVEGKAEYRAALDFEDGSRAVTSYRLIRYSNFDPNGDPTTGTKVGLGNAIVGNTYTDGGATWAALPAGWYAYGVAANYPNNFISDTVVSNIVGHKILAEVTVNVSLTTGGSPAGAVVMLTGQDYPYEHYMETVPESGQIIFPTVWYGHYVVDAMKVGFDDYSITVNITGNRTIDIILLEKKYKPRNLYVDPLTLVATWDEPLAIAVGEDFEGATFPPAGWQALTQNTTGWYATTNGSSGSWTIPSHTKYAVTNDDADNGDGCCDYLITPEMDWTDLPSYRLNFASFYDGAFSQSAYVEISTDAGATWTVINTLSTATTWVDLEIDLAQYSGANGLGSVWLAFHADDNGVWASGWAIDDVVIQSGGVPFNGYGVFLDGTLVDNTPEETYTYQDLNYGQEYLAGVAALFSSGYSELDTYLFRSLFLYPPDSLQGESPYNTDYAHLWWQEPGGGGGGTGGSFTEDFEAGVLSDGWETIQTNTNSSATPCYWTVTDYVSADFSPFGVYHAGLWWDYGHQDEWLITPEVACGAASTLTFESTVWEGSTYLDHYYVKVSTDGGTNWDVVWDASTLTGNGWNYYDYPYSIDLSAYAGEDIKIAFQAIDGDGAGLWYIWFVDNIAFGATDGVTMFPASSLTRISNSTNRGSSDRIARDGSTNRVSEATMRANRDVMGLIGYNLYRDGDLTAYVEHPTTEYFDLNLDPGTYSYHVTAVYDLTPYGFAGQIGESMIEGPVEVTVTYGYDLPFTEDWNTGLFETNQWTTSGANWKIAGQTGNPAPSAEFTYDPIQTDYALSLTSSWINGIGPEGFIDGKFYLDFDLKLDDINATGDETLQVEVYNGSAWVTVVTFTAEGDMPWEMKHVDITGQAKNKVFRVRFNAKGMNTLDIFNWQIDNIHIYRVCAPPTNLTATINFPALDEVLLTWEAPEGGGTLPSAWLGWDNGVNDDAIGLTGGGTFSIAARFTPAQLAQYAGTSLTKLRFFPYSEGTFVLKVWTGANAGTLVVTQPLASVTVGEWNEVAVTTPVFVTGAEELWFGYTVTHGADLFPAGVDVGPAVAGFGDMISLDGSVWESMATQYALNFNWNMNGYVEGIDGVTALQPISDNAVYGPVSQLVRGNLPMSPNATVTNTTTNGSRELVGYNVWRAIGEDAKVIIATTAETSYLDETVEIGNLYCYQVQAVYEDCESDPSNEVCLLVDNVPVVETSAVSVYPNPSNNVVNIELTNDISQIVVYNYVGQVVYEQVITKDKTIELNVRGYEAGAYLIKFITNTGESFTKKVAVTH